MRRQRAQQSQEVVDVVLPVAVHRGDDVRAFGERELDAVPEARRLAAIHRVPHQPDGHAIERGVRAVGRTVVDDDREVGDDHGPLRDRPYRRGFVEGGNDDGGLHRYIAPLIASTWPETYCASSETR